MAHMLFSIFSVGSEKLNFRFGHKFMISAIDYSTRELAAIFSIEAEF